MLGIAPEFVEIGRLPVRHFPSRRQEILQIMIDLRKRLNPDLVLAPSQADTHQDHATVAVEAFRAFKHTTLLGYELPQNLVDFENTAFVRLSEDIVNAKIAAMASYGSQNFRPYATSEFMRGLASVRGAQCNSQYAEAYDVRRWIL